MTDLLAVVGRNVRALRGAQNMSQSDLALRVGCTRSSVANLEVGRQNIGLELVAALAKAFGVQPADLVGETAEPASVYAHGWHDGAAHATNLVRLALDHVTNIAPERPETP